MRKVFIVDSSAVIRSIEKNIIQMTSKFECVGESCNLKDIINIPHRTVDFIVVEASKKNILEVERLLLQKKPFSSTLILLSDEKIELLRPYSGVYIWKKPDFLSCSSDKLAELAKIVELKLEDIKTTSFFNRKVVKERKSFAEKKYIDIKKNSNKGNDFHYENYRVVLIGVSTGGPGAILKLLDSIGKKFPLPILITQHIDSSFEKNLTEWLNKSLAMPVHIAENGVVPMAGHVYFAPADFHMTVGLNKKDEIVIKLTKEPPVNFLRPAVDKLFVSGAETLGPDVISVLLTGMGADGAVGSCKLREAGAYTIAEAEETCVIYGMPKAAYDMGGIVELVPLYKIADKLQQLVKKR